MPEIGYFHTGFLAAGAAAAAVPVLIHLLLRQRARTVEIGSVRFLRNVIRQHTRRRRIRQWLLLALRIAALLLLGLLFARPYLDRSLLLGMNRDVTMLVDRSASMGAKAATGGSLLEQAWQQIGDEVDRLDRNTRIRVAMFDAAGVEEISVEALSKPPAASDAATDYTAALAWARDVVSLSTRPRQVVHLWADLQQSGLRGRVEGFPPDVEVVVHDVGRKLMQNIGLDDARATAVEIRPARPVTVSAVLHNASPLPVDAVPVALKLNGPDGEITERLTIDLPGNRTRAAVFPLDVETPGLYRGQVTISPEDDLACDDRRFVAFEVRYPDRVLLVDGQAGRSVFENETYYFEMALRLDVPSLESSPRTYQIERIAWEDGQGFPDLTGFRVIAMANLRQLRETDLQRLQDYVTFGGRLLYFTGDQTSAATVAEMSERGLAPGTIEVVPDSGLLRVTSWDAAHPIFAPFADPQHGDLRRLVFRRMNRWESVNPTAKVLMSVGDRPLMLEQSVGQGRIVWCGTSVDRQWSDWPQDRLFVPLIRQTMAYLTDQLGELQTVQTVLVKAPQEQAGIFQREAITVVRNLDPRESTLARVSPQDFRKSLGLQTGDEEAASDAEAELLPPKFAQRPDETWPLAMWLLLAVLAAETLLASRIHA